MISQLTSFLSSNTLVLAALSDNDIISMQTKFQEDLHIVKFWFAVLRDIGWSIIYQLLKLLDISPAVKSFLLKSFNISRLVSSLSALKTLVILYHLLIIYLTN